MFVVSMVLQHSIAAEIERERDEDGEVTEGRSGAGEGVAAGWD